MSFSSSSEYFSHLNLGSREAGVLIFTPSNRSTKTSDKNPANSAVSLNSQSPLKCQVIWLPGRPWVERLRRSHVHSRSSALWSRLFFCRTCLNGGRQLDRDTKTNWTAHRRDVRAQKPHEPFGRCCYLRINSATVIRSVNASLFIVFPPLSAKWAFFMHTNHLAAMTCSLSYSHTFSGTFRPKGKSGESERAGATAWVAEQLSAGYWLTPAVGM